MFELRDENSCSEPLTNSLGQFVGTYFAPKQDTVSVVDIEPQYDHFGNIIDYKYLTRFSNDAKD